MPAATYAGLPKGHDAARQCFMAFSAHDRIVQSRVHLSTLEWLAILPASMALPPTSCRHVMLAGPVAPDGFMPGDEFSAGQLVKMIHSGVISNLPKEVAKVYGSSTTHEKSEPNPYFGVQVGHILRARRGTRFGPTEIYLERSSQDLHNKVVLYRIGRGNGA